MNPSHEEEGHRPPVPLPSESPPPRAGWLKLLLSYRFFLVTLVIVLFLVLLFGWETYRSAEAPSATPGAAIHAPLVKPPEAAKPPEAVKPPEPEAHPAPAPHEEAPIPAPPPAALPLRPPVKGEVFTRALIKIMDAQVNQTMFGWRPNTIPFGKLGLTDNVNQIQLGVLEVARRTVVVLNENMTRFATTEAYNPQVNEAMNYFMVSPDKYWFPSASGKYREAIVDLQLYIDNLAQGRSRFYTRVDNIIALLSQYKDILGSSYHNLIKDTEADGRQVSWWLTDDYFYFAKGIALGMTQMLEAVEKDFHQELTKKNAHKLLGDAHHALHTAAHLSPWLVTNGSKDGFLANHRANMSTYIGEAEHVIATLHTVLATN